MQSHAADSAGQTLSEPEVSRSSFRRSGFPWARKGWPKVTPYRVQQGTLKPTKMPGLAMLVLMLCHMPFPLAMVPVFVPPLADFLWQAAGWSNAVPVNLILSVTLAALVSLGYWQAIGPLGRLLQRRENRILAVVTVEVE